mmetsp:Transcript_22072/g.25831  ORF Transcript_22072/g.25831 Transcript_22072/m.25831 type:complete len:82 (+) Transcript_22072:227-472(+)
MMVRDALYGFQKSNFFKIWLELMPKKAQKQKMPSLEPHRTAFSITVLLNRYLIVSGGMEQIPKKSDKVDLFDTVVGAWIGG